MRNGICKWVSVFIVSIVLLMFTSCGRNGQAVKSNDKDEAITYSYEGNLKFTGLKEGFEISYNDIFNMESVTRHMKNVSSDGTEKEVDVTGVLLETILSQYGINQNDFSTIRLIAGDGYSIDLPEDIISSKEIVLAYKFNNEPLEKNKQPLRVAINDVRSMYYVSNLAEINFSSSSPANEEAAKKHEITKMVFLETAVKNLELNDYTYYENIDKAIKTQELLDNYNGKTSEQVSFVAADGFEKTEAIEVFLTAYIKITGENNPLFTSQELPKGMQVKNIMLMSCGDTAYISSDHCIETFSKKKIDKYTGASLEEVIELVRLVGDKYLITGVDGYNVEISKEDLIKGIVYKRDENLYALKFQKDVQKSANVKDVLSIEIISNE